MKKLLLIAALSITSLIPAAAQSFDPAVLLSAATVTSGSTSNYTSTVSTKLCDYAGVGISFVLAGAGTDNVVFKFAKSADGSTFETTPSITVTVAANGTTAVNVFSAATVQGCNALKLASIAGSTNAGTTNITVKIFPKRLR